MADSEEVRCFATNKTMQPLQEPAQSNQLGGGVQVVAVPAARRARHLSTDLSILNIVFDSQS